MFHHEHMASSRQRLREQGNDLFSLAPKIIEEILEELHSEFDKHYNPSLKLEVRVKHRAILHHQEGIEEITRKLTKRYGAIYEDLIRQEAREHVIADMGKVYRKKDYQEPCFWPHWREVNETICAWI